MIFPVFNQIVAFKTIGINDEEYFCETVTRYDKTVQVFIYDTSEFK